jgi:elongation factor Ts
MSENINNIVNELVKATGSTASECEKAIKAYGAEKAKHMLLLQRLRASTGCGIQKCKDAINAAVKEANGESEFDYALNWLRKECNTGFEKRANNDTLEGCFGIFDSDRYLTIVEVLCETDFVSNNPLFRAAANKLTEYITHHRHILDNKAEFMNHIDKDIAASLTPFGENVRIGRVKIFEKNKGPVFHYLHESGSNKIIGAVQFGPNFGHIIAKQIVATNPKVIHLHEITDEIAAQRPDSKKEELAIMTQTHMFDSKLTIGDYLKTINIIDFTRICIGQAE